MKLRPLVYIKSPFGVCCRLKRDIPFWLRGTSFYADERKKRPPATIPSKATDEEVNAYLNYRTKRKARGVIYTCITNDYDDITIISHPPYINNEWDYICFTDNQEDCDKKQIGIWQIRPIAKNNLDFTRQNRWHKMHPHILFPDYNESIYVDANVILLSHSIFDEIKDKNSNLVIPLHPTRHCIYEEYNNALAEFMDSATLIRDELKLIRRSGMPKGIGLTENNLIYRRHNESNIIELMCEWWFMVENFAKRDQLSLCWCLWQHNIKIEDISIPHCVMQSERYIVVPHRKRNRNK